MSAGCQVGGDNDEIGSSVPNRGLIPRPPAERGVAPLCLRCNVERCTTVHRQQPLCRSCFLSTFITRFRQTLRRQCGVQPATHVIVGWSGGLSSTTLCELIREGRADRGKHRLLLHWDIVHVDCTAIRRHTSDEQRRADEEERTQLLSRFQTITHVIPLSAVFDIPADRHPVHDTADNSRTLFYSSDPSHRAACDERLRVLFRSVQPSDHASLLSALLAHLLSYFCLSGGYSSLLTGQSATHAATAVISDITKGRGRTAAVHTRMQRRLLGARWAYPLHDFSHTHIGYLFHYHKLSTLSAIGPIHIAAAHASSTALSASFTAASSAASTLDTLSRSFIASLDSLFGHSVANVLRTVEKVDRPDDTDSQGCCCWCGEQLPPTQQFEISLSTQSYPQLTTDAASSNHATQPTLATLDRRSCYNCRRAFSQPLWKQADPLSCTPDCVRHFDSTAACQQQQQAWDEADGEDTAAVTSQQTAGRTNANTDGSTPSLTDSAEQRARHARRHGAGGSGSSANHRGSKQSAEQLKAHIQQFLIDESNEAGGASS